MMLIILKNGLIIAPDYAQYFGSESEAEEFIKKFNLEDYVKQIASVIWPDEKGRL